MTDLIDSGWSSDCHKAPVRVVGGTEGTYHWECTKCGQSCNATNPGIDMADEDLEPSVGYSNPPEAIEDKLKDLREDIQDYLKAIGMAEPWDYERCLEDYTNGIQAIITTETTNAREDERKKIAAQVRAMASDPKLQKLFGDLGSAE